MVSSMIGDSTMLIQSFVSRFLLYQIQTNLLLEETKIHIIDEDKSHEIKFKIGEYSKDEEWK